MVLRFRLEFKVKFCKQLYNKLLISLKYKTFCPTCHTCYIYEEYTQNAMNLHLIDPLPFDMYDLAYTLLT